MLAEMKNIASARESLQEQLFISESRCSKFEAEIAHIERTASDRERAYHDTIAAQRRQVLFPAHCLRAWVSSIVEKSEWYGARTHAWP